MSRVGKLDQAIASYIKVLAWGESHQDKEYVAAAYGNLGNVYKLQGDQYEAKRYWEMSVKIFNEIGSPKALRFQSLLDEL